MKFISWSGIEPYGRCYIPAFRSFTMREQRSTTELQENWLQGEDSNLRSPAYETGDLTTCPPRDLTKRNQSKSWDYSFAKFRENYTMSLQATNAYSVAQCLLCVKVMHFSVCDRLRPALWRTKDLIGIVLMRLVVLCLP